MYILNIRVFDTNRWYISLIIASTIHALNANIVQPSQFRSKLLYFQNKINYPHFLKEVKTFFFFAGLLLPSIPEYILYRNIEYMLKFMIKTKSSCCSIGSYQIAQKK